MKKQKSYFLVLPKNGDVFFASWKIDAKEIPAKISESLKKNGTLIIEVYSVSGSRIKKIEFLRVHGMENNWHIFTGEEYRGKRLIFKLCHRGARGKVTELLASKELDVPLSITKISVREKSAAKKIFHLSRINIGGFADSGKNSSW